MQHARIGEETVEHVHAVDDLSTAHDSGSKAKAPEQTKGDTH
jgi:hypothetical protein